MSDGVVVVDKEAGITVFNPSAERILGVERTADSLRNWRNEHHMFYPDRVNAVPARGLSPGRRPGGADDGERRRVREASADAGRPPHQRQRPAAAGPRGAHPRRRRRVPRRHRARPRRRGAGPGVRPGAPGGGRHPAAQRRQRRQQRRRRRRDAPRSVAEQRAAAPPLRRHRGAGRAPGRLDRLSAGRSAGPPGAAVRPRASRRLREAAPAVHAAHRPGPRPRRPISWTSCARSLRSAAA